MKKIMGLFGVFAGASVLGILLVIWNPLQTVQWKISDLFFRGRSVSSEITIIAIDDKSLQPAMNLGRFSDWPRTYYSQILREINKHNPAVVAFDLDFRESSRGMSDLRIKQALRAYERGESIGDWYEFIKKFEQKNTEEVQSTHPDDIDFQNTLDESNSIVFRRTLILAEKVEEKTLKFPAVKGVMSLLFNGKNISWGFAKIIPDRDGVFRRFALTASEFKNFTARIAEEYSKVKKREVYFPDLEHGEQLLINYSGKPYSYRTISFSDVFFGKFKPEDVEGKIILIGATAPILQDTHPTPTSNDLMPGVEINANIIQQLLEGKMLFDQPHWSLILELLLFALGGAAAFLFLPLRFGLGIFALILVLLPASAFALYQNGLVLNVVYPEITWLATFLGSLFYRNQTEFREKRAITAAFSRYVSPIVVDELTAHPEALSLGGKKEKISVFFSDIAGFTTFAEKLSPEDTVAVLNDYLTQMTEVIFNYHGTLDKYQGDAIMALFGAPLKNETYALNACAAALQMRKALAALHEKWSRLPTMPLKEELVKLDFRVGIATGEAVLGNVGSEKRFDYTAIGDIVNLGSRLESLNKKYGTHIIVDGQTVSEITADKTNKNPFLFRKLDTVRVKGKQKPTEIFELVGFAETGAEYSNSAENSATQKEAAGIKSMLVDFENGRLLYTQKNFPEAHRYFENILAKTPTDGPAQIYLRRSEFFMKNPPADPFDPIIDLEEK